MYYNGLEALRSTARFSRRDSAGHPERYESGQPVQRATIAEGGAVPLPAVSGRKTQKEVLS
jgi:hypothetical protein